MEMSTIIKSVVSLFLIMFVGIYGCKKGIINDSVNKGLAQILLQIALPCMVITSFSFPFDESIKANVIKTFYYSFITYIIIATLSYIFMTIVKDERKTILHFSNVFTNTGYIGFPILNSVYGAEAVVYGSVFNIFFTIFLWTYGIIIFKGKMDKKEILKELLNALKNPSLIAVYIGMILMIFDFKLPEVISYSASSIASMTGPLSMIVVGAMAYKINIKEYIKDWTIYYGTLVKLIIIPGILCLISLLIKDMSMVSSSIIVLASMPAAAMTSIFADSFDVQREYAAAIVVTTTLLSVFTIPVLLKIIG